MEGGGKRKGGREEKLLKWGCSRNRLLHIATRKVYMGQIRHAAEK